MKPDSAQTAQCTWRRPCRRLIHCPTTLRVTGSPSIFVSPGLLSCFTELSGKSANSTRQLAEPRSCRWPCRVVGRHHLLAPVKLYNRVKRLPCYFELDAPMTPSLMRPPQLARPQTHYEPSYVLSASHCRSRFPPPSLHIWSSDTFARGRGL